MKNKTIAFVNQKGGVGKSTLAALYASYLAYHKKTTVVVFDCDFPQHSLSGLREQDKKRLGSDDQLLNQRYKQAMGDHGEYPILEYSMDDIEKIIEKINKEQDGITIIFDLPGTFNIDSFSAAIKHIDYGIVPFGPSISEFEATFMSIEILFKQNPNIEVVSVLNRVKRIVNSKQNEALAFALRSNFKNQNFHFLNHKVYDLEVYKRDLLTLTVESESLKFFEELDQIINLQENGKAELSQV